MNPRLVQASISYWLLDEGPPVAYPADPTPPYLASHLRAGERVIGRAQLVVHHNREASLWSVEIAPELRGRGYGRTLMGLLLGEARRRGAHKIWLRVDETNVVARHLYETLGFVQEDDKSVRYQYTYAVPLTQPKGDTQ